MKETFILKTKPISVNALYQGRRFLTKEGKAIKLVMASEIRKQWKKSLITNDVGIEIDFFFKNRRMDIDNAIKSLLDCMTGIIWKDDCQIVELKARKWINKKDQSISITVEECKPSF
jgi:crossover junction endodeoxyribonuclease RusA